jgi:RNA polymerase sigma factor (sigma-70 family)
LVRRLEDSDGAALSQLYQRFGRPCYSLARRICADEGLAEDVVQEVFLTLWRDPTRFDPARGGFATWLLTLIHHKAVDAVRRESTIRRRIVAAPEAGEDWSPTPIRLRWNGSRPDKCVRPSTVYRSSSGRCSRSPTSVGTLSVRSQFSPASR